MKHIGKLSVVIGMLGILGSVTGMDQYEQFMLDIKKYEFDKARAIEKNSKTWIYCAPKLVMVPIPFDGIAEPSEKPVRCLCESDCIVIFKYVPFERSCSELFYEITGPRKFRLQDWICLPCTLLKNCISPFVFYRRDRYILDATWKRISDLGAWSGTEEDVPDTDDTLVIKKSVERLLLKHNLIKGNEWCVSVHRYFHYMAVVVPACEVLYVLFPSDVVSMYVPQKWHDCFIKFE